MFFLIYDILNNKRFKRDLKLKSRLMYEKVYKLNDYHFKKSMAY